MEGMKIRPKRWNTGKEEAEIACFQDVEREAWVKECELPLQKCLLDTLISEKETQIGFLILRMDGNEFEFFKRVTSVIAPSAIKL